MDIGFKDVVSSPKGFLGGFFNGLRSLWKSFTHSGLTDQQVQQNEYMTGEREQAQAFEERMSNTAFQRQVSDMKQAGVNPAIMYGGAGSNGASSPSSAGMSASGLTSPATMSELIQLLTLKPTIENLKANAALTRQKVETERAETGLREIVRDMYPDLTNAQIGELLSRQELNIKKGAEADAIVDFTRAKETYQRLENDNYADLLVLKKACLRAEKDEKISEKELNEVRKAVAEIERQYMADHKVKMTDAGRYGLILAIADKLGLNPNRLKSFFTMDVSHNGGSR